MKRLLQRERRLADHFIAHTLATNIRIEQHLLAHLFNLDSTERRLARALLRLAGYGTGDAPTRRGPKVFNERLAHLAGTTCARVDVLMRESNAWDLSERAATRRSIPCSSASSSTTEPA